MSTQIQYRRGTAAQNDAFTGAQGEITVDTTNFSLRVHDGISPGGTALSTRAWMDNAATHANSAYNKANSGYTQANTGTSHAASAYNHANASFTHANSAYGHANSAYDKANSGYTQANTGTAHAVSSYDHANSAYGHANSAYDKANSAYDHANTKFASAGGTVSGDITVTGNLIVSGTTVTVSANNLSVEDNMIYLNHGLSGNSYPDLGFVGAYSNGSYQHTGLFRDQSDGFWKFFDGYKPEPDDSVYIDTANATFRLAPLSVSSITATTSNVGTVETGTWQGTSISTTYTDAKITSVGAQTGAISNTQLLNFIISVDGTGSGLDADLLDGQDGTYYTNASSISSGTLATARLATGTANAETYLRGDQTWAPVASGGVSGVKLYYFASF